MFQKTKLKKSYLSAIGMSLVLLLVNTLGLLLDTRVGQLVPPATDEWINHVEAPLGSGTSESDPYIIDTPSKLAYIAKNDQSETNTRYLELTKDIDLGGYLWNTGLILGAVYLNGNNHTIFNLTGSSGLITRADYGTSYISNLTITNFSINTDRSFVAVVVESSYDPRFDNVNLSSGTIVGKDYVGGLNSSNAYVYANNCVVNAKIVSNNVAGGIIAQSSSAEIFNCVVSGEIIGNSNVGGISGVDVNKVENCYVEAKITGNNNVGGISGQYLYGCINSGFNGEINLTGTDAKNIATIAVNLGIYENSFGIAEIFLNGNDKNCILPFGVLVNLSDFASDIKSIYSFSRVYQNDGTTTELRKYKVGTDEAPFSGMAVHKNINGGFPFPKSLFAVGQFIDSDVMGYLEEYGFSKFNYPLYKKGNHYYVELGEYPQTYVGDSLNSTLKSWYASNNPSSVDSYTNDKGTSADTITHYAYSYNGNKYVRVVSAILNNSSGYKTQDEATTLMPNQEYWFKVEPIKWWVLNYTDVQNGANPIVLAEQGLTANVTWNKTEADGNLWVSKSNIRTWLNSTFYNDAFKVGYADYIQTTIVKNNSSSSNTDGSGTTTNDNVWLLSYGEAGGGNAGQYSENRYFNDNPSRLCSPTDYALVNKCYMNVNASYPTEIRKNGGSCIWWLRSANTSYTSNAQSVLSTGSLNYGDVYYSNLAVRPALMLAI